MNLRDYVKGERGRAAQLARAIDKTPSFVAQMAAGRRRPPAEICPGIELATGGRVHRRDLRPDDWHRIWPELVEPRPTESPKDAMHREAA